MFTDRKPTRPNRYKVTPDDGSAAYYVTLERADEPTVEGTPLNAAALNALIEQPTSALVGQYLRVSDVDENNKPSKWVAANISTSLNTSMARGSWNSEGTINCGFRPDVVFITEGGETGAWAKVWDTAMPYKEMDGNGYMPYSVLEATDTGFIVRNDSGDAFLTDTTYYYLAVKFAAPVISGKWYFNEEVVFPASTLYEPMHGGVKIGSGVYSGVRLNGSIKMIYGEEQLDTFSDVYDDGWYSEEDRTWDFGESESEVSDEFYVWLTANAVKV